MLHSLVESINNLLNIVIFDFLKYINIKKNMI